ncbi:EA22-like protein; similarities with EA22 from lambda (modular protein involved in blocking host replication) [Escherichia coli]|nr:EA22-like protein; similarities with EA22 from lambda (modular protein involved in blocking host replication) [Escherichia coli]
MTITKQRVEEIISRIEMYGHGAGYTAEEVYDLAVLALNLSNIANLKRYELDMGGCDSCGQDCGADMTEDSDGDYVLFDDVVKLFEFDTFESPARETPVNKIDYQALREAAQLATQGEWVAFISSGTGTYAVHTPGDKRCEDVIKWTGFDGQENAENNARYIAAFNPEVVQALLDERERNQQYIKRRDQENEDIALTVGKLLIENGRLVADTLRHLADNEIDSDYFAITSTNENGTEIDHEMAITDYALQAAGTVDELVAALEAAEKRIAELEAREILLPERSSMLHRTDFHDDYQTVMAYKVSEVIDAIRAAGIRIKGE